MSDNNNCLNCYGDLTLCSECDERLSYPLDYAYQQIEKFPHLRTVTCRGQTFQISTLKVYTEPCPGCGGRHKHMHFGSPIEIPDIITLCKKWLETHDKEVAALTNQTATIIKEE